MGIIQAPRKMAAQEGVIGAPKFMTSGDSYATITASAYLNNIDLAVYPVVASDVIGVTYNYNTVTKAGNFGWFTVSINNGVITLLPLISNQTIVETTLTAAQWNGMYANPVLIVPAPLSNQIITVEKMMIVQEYGTTQFQFGGAVAAQYGNTAHGGGSLATFTNQASDFTSATSSTLYQIAGISGNGQQVTLANCAGQGIYLSNANAAFTTGDSTFNVRVIFDIISSVS